jgi:exopolyphosphatase/guanosine-5'-triphosphate,3'-diphosphate pyrophosphatase
VTQVVPVLEDDSLERPTVAAADRLLQRTLGSDPHPRHVAALAVALAREAREPLELTRRAEHYLALAGLLHDLGWSVSGRGHHKHSAKLVADDRTVPLDEQERAVVAALCRYHRKADPAPHHPEWQAVLEEQRGELVRMAALLRVADGLDRGHRQAVRRLSLDSGPPRRLVIGGDGQLDAEIAGADRKAALLRCYLREEIGIAST